MTQTLEPIAAPTPEAVDYDKLLRFKVMKGLREYGLTEKPEYLARVEYELGVISQTKFSAYFLIVGDLCRFMRQAKPRPIRFMVRGSGCGSLCVWLLKISHAWLDPIKLDLPFERFLNPARVSNPDLDIDIDDTRRAEVVAYTIQKYGEQRVAKIATFGTLGAKAAIADIARAQQIPDYQLVAAGISGLISSKPGTELATELANCEALREKQRAWPKLFDMALKVEGKVRHASVHAAGTIITPEDVWNYLPTFWKGQPEEREEHAKFPTTQWDMYDVEKLGLLKMDYLGLKCLRVIDQTEQLVNMLNRAAGKPEINIDEIDRKDPAAWALLARGDLAGVFQIEKQFVRNFAKRMNLNRMEPWDLAVLVAIIRPGMMDCGATEKFLKRASGQEQPTPIIPKLGELGVLKHKYELFVFQEDCMLVAVKLAGFTMSEADELRRAIGKKQKDKIDKIHPKFIEGCIKTSGVTAEEANIVWAQMETFARYGFNNAHAAAYGCVLSYQTAWLKAHYPLPYMTCMMNSEAGGSSKEFGYNYKVAEYGEEARAMGIQVTHPCIKRSAGWCRLDPAANQTIFGLNLIKGASTAGIDWVLRNCRGANSFVEFVLNCFEVVDTGVTATRSSKGKQVETPFTEHKHYSRVNKATIEGMIWTGALDVFVANDPAERPRLAAMVEELLELAEKFHKSWAMTKSGRNPQVPAGDWLARLRGYRLQEDKIEQTTMETMLDRERALTGCFLTYSPFAPFAKLRRERDLADFEDIQSAEFVELGAMVLVRQAREFICKNGRAKGRAMLRLNLDAVGGSFECPIFPDDLDSLRVRHNGQSIEAGKVYIVYLKRDRAGTGYICTNYERVSDMGLGGAA